MVFLMGWPLMGVGVLCAGIPILIHLLHRQRTTPLHWGAMQFLMDSPIRSKRRRRVDQWLLMAVRVLALLVLAWLLARPVVRSQIAGPLGTASVDIAVVVDHSLSMGRTVTDHTALDEAVGAVDSISERIRAGDTLSVVLAEHRPRNFTALPAGMRQTADIRRALHQLPAGQTDCSIPEAIQSARELLARGGNSRKLVLVASDQQKGNWQIGDTTAWQSATQTPNETNHSLDVRYLTLTPPPDAMNVSATGLTIEPNLVGVGRAIQILVTLANHGKKDAAGVDVHLTIDGHETVTSQQIPLLAVGQTTTLRFTCTFDSAGSHWIKAATDFIDAFPMDNSIVSGVFVWKRLPVLVIDGQLTRAGSFKSAQFLAAAMQPTDPASFQPALIQPTVISTADAASVNLDDFYVVVLNDIAELPPELEQRVADYAVAGHGVWIILGPRTLPQFINESLGMEHLRLARIQLKSASPVSAAIPPPIEIRSTANPMIAMIASSEKNALAGAAVMRWWSLTPQDGDDQIVLAANGDPLIFEHPVGSNGGRVAVWTTSADASWNSWPVMPNFVPLVNETVYHLSSAQTGGHRNGTIAAGTPLAWSGPAAPEIQSLDVIPPSGSIERGRRPTFRNGRWEFEYANTFDPGLYQLRFSPESASGPVYFGVGIDPGELNTTTLSKTDFRWLSDNGFARELAIDQVAPLITRQTSGTELWKLLAMVLLGGLIIETILTFRMARTVDSVDSPAPASPLAA